MIRVRQIFFLLLFLFFSNGVMAMSLEECVSLAKKNNPKLLKSTHELSIIREREKQAFANLKPTIDIRSFRSKVDQDRSDQGGLSIKQKYNTETDALTFRQPIYRPAFLKDYRRAKKEVESGESLFQLKFQALLLNLSEVYMSSVKFKEEEKLMLAKINHLKNKKIAAEKAYEAGVGTVTEKAEILAAIDRTEVDYLRTKQQLKVSTTDLSFLIGEKIKRIHNFKDIYADIPVFSSFDVDEWVRLALSGSHLLARLRSDIDAAKLGLQSEKYNRYPTLDLSIDVTRGTSESTFFVNTETKSESVGILFNLPIYQGGRLHSKVREAASTLSMMQAELEFQEDELKKSIQKTFFGLLESKARHGALIGALNSARLVLESNEKSFTAGYRKQLDILNAQQKVYDIEKDLVNAKVEMVKSWMALNQFSGTLTEERFLDVDKLLH